MSMIKAVKGLLDKNGWSVEVDNLGDGSVEALALAGDLTESYIGPISGLAKWARLLPDVSEPVEEEETMSVEDWEAEYGGMSDADIEAALKPATVVEEWLPIDAPVAEENPNIQKDKKENSMAKFDLGSLFAKKEEAPKEKADTSIALPPVTVSVPTAEAKQDIEEAFRSCALLNIDYSSFSGNITMGRDVRIGSVTEDKLYAWDVAAFNETAAELEKLLPGTSHVVIAQAAAKKAQRTFRLARLLGYRVTGEVAAPINAPNSGVLVLRPCTEAGVSVTGNGFPFPVNKTTAEKLLETGDYEVVPEGI